MKNSKLLLYAVMFFAYSTAVSQSKSIIIKFKSDTPAEIVNNFRNNNPKSGNSSVSKLSRELDVKNSREVFGNLNRVYSNNESYKRTGLDRIFIVNTDENKFQLFLNTAGISINCRGTTFSV